MNFFVIALALIANTCVAFVPPVVLVQLSSSFNSHVDFRKAAKEATVEMNMVKAAKEATAEVRDELVRRIPPLECVESSCLCFVTVGIA